MRATDVRIRDKDTGISEQRAASWVQSGPRGWGVLGSEAGQYMMDAQFGCSRGIVGPERAQVVEAGWRARASLCPPAEERHEAGAEHHADDRKDELGGAPLDHLFVEHELVCHKL